MRKLMLIPSENDRAPTDCSSVLSDSYFQKLKNYKQQIKSLEASNEALKQKTERQEEAISDLKSTIASLTEENIHLRAKISNFKSFSELCSGIEQTSQLIRFQFDKSQTKSNPLVKSRPNSSLVEEIEELRLDIDKRKREYNNDQSSTFFHTDNPKEGRPLRNRIHKNKVVDLKVKRIIQSIRKKRTGKSLESLPTSLKSPSTLNFKYK